MGCAFICMDFDSGSWKLQRFTFLFLSSTAIWCDIRWNRRQLQSTVARAADFHTPLTAVSAVSVDTKYWCRDSSGVCAVHAVNWHLSRWAVVLHLPLDLSKRWIWHEAYFYFLLMLVDRGLGKSRAQWLKFKSMTLLVYGIFLEIVRFLLSSVAAQANQSTPTILKCLTKKIVF